MRLRALIAGAALPLGLWALVPLSSEGASPASRIASLRSRIDATRSTLARKRGTERVLTTDVSAYTRRIDRLQGDISALEGRQARIQADLDRQRSELIRIQDDLRRERARLARLKARLAEARATLARRLVALYKADAPDAVTVILNSNGFADLVERGDFIKRVSDQDRRIIGIVRTAKADAVSTARRLDHLEARQQQVTALVLRRRNQVAQVKRQLVDRRAGFARTRAGKAHALAAVSFDRRHLQKQPRRPRVASARVQSELAAAQQQNAGQFDPGVAGPVRRGSGTLIWPVNGPITSPFCERRAWESCHPGIDIGVPSGTPIRAADNGKVVLLQGEGSSGGYGNFTCVQHTATMSTCYAHQSRFAVSLGQSVSQGQVIGYSGCTGRCFGPHLHFEVRINGAVVDPMGYL